MAVSDGVNSTYEISYLAVLFYNYVYLEKIGGLNVYFKNKETEKCKGMASQNVAIRSMHSKFLSK